MQTTQKNEILLIIGIVLYGSNGYVPGYSGQDIFFQSGKKREVESNNDDSNHIGFSGSLSNLFLQMDNRSVFQECQTAFGMTKCQSRDFDAQIASLTLRTLWMLQYNILSVVRRFEAYETLGELFKENRKDHLKIPLGERILLIIIEIAKELAPLLENDSEELMEKYLSENEKIKNYINFESLIGAA